MDMRFFFEGKLSREESSSAWLATLLHQHAGFRSAFLRAAGLPDALSSEQPEVSVERDEHDVRLEYTRFKHAVIIENKLRAGSIQPDQLKGYFCDHKNRNPDVVLTMVFLTPRPGMGGAEVNRFREAVKLQGEDPLKVLDWVGVTQLLDTIPIGDPFHGFAHTGMTAILRIIDLALQEKYPLVGDRLIVGNIEDLVFDNLSIAAPDVAWRRWRAKDRHSVYSALSDFTVEAQIVFGTDTDHDHQPIGVTHPKRASLELQVCVQLSDMGQRRSPPLKKVWRDIVAAGKAEVPGLGVLRGLKNNWMHIRHDTIGSPDKKALANELSAMTLAVIRWTQKL